MKGRGDVPPKAGENKSFALSWTVHDLKTVQPYFDDAVWGRKRFEVRNNDRQFEVGDLLLLQELAPATDYYTGRMALFQVVYIFEGGQFGLAEDYVVLGIEPRKLEPCNAKEAS